MSLTRRGLFQRILTHDDHAPGSDENALGPGQQRALARPAVAA